MPENPNLICSIDRFDVEFVVRQATPKLVMKLSIQFHLGRLSLSKTVSVLDIFGVERARSTVYNWIHKAELQLEDDQSPDQVTVDKKVIWIDGEQYWLYAAVDPESNKFSKKSLKRPQTSIFRNRSSIDSATNTISMALSSSSMDLIRYTMDVLVTISISDRKSTEIGIAPNVLSEK
jgi:hypothetical protein